MKEHFRINRYAKREEYAVEFDRISDLLLNHCVLVSPKHRFRIRELEFYYLSAEHMDCYCHCYKQKAERQRGFLLWYFHRFKNPDKYANLRQKGVDVTLGQEDCCGGILLRTVEDLATGEVLTGPGRIVNRLMEDIGGGEAIQELYDSGLDACDTNSPLYIKQSKLSPLDIFKRSRYGLNLHKDDLDAFFRDAKYAYFTFPAVGKVKLKEQIQSY